jgi:hypothetical protein
MATARKSSSMVKTWVVMASDTSAATIVRTAWANARNFFRFIRSASPPIGIAKSNHGNIVKAEIAEIETGDVVNLTAMSGTETRKIPSAKLLDIAADQSRLKAEEKFVIEILKAFLDYVRLRPSKYLQLPFPWRGLDLQFAHLARNEQYLVHM